MFHTVRDRLSRALPGFPVRMRGESEQVEHRPAAKSGRDRYHLCGREIPGAGSRDRFFATADADFDGTKACYDSHSIEAGIRYCF